MVEYQGKKYQSKKHPVLEYIFNKYNPDKNISQEIITFTLKDISEGYRACGISEPASISNTILDLVRQERSIESRLPQSIYKLGYDLRKRTGPSPNGYNYAGEFVYVGVGNVIQSWLVWPSQADKQMNLSSILLPVEIRPYLRNDEGALFSVIDYCDVLSQILYGQQNIVMRVQNPMKWQPNEIDGFYFAKINNEKIVFPIEAKALTTGDDVNLEQLQGGLNVVLEKYTDTNLWVQPLAIKMIKNGLQVAVFKKCKIGQIGCKIELEKTISVTFVPPIESWQ